jgi:hypothetical protein
MDLPKFLLSLEVAVAVAPLVLLAVVELVDLFTTHLKF